MAQQRSQRMLIVLQLAERAEQQAAEHLATAREQLGSDERQLNQLQDYRLDYISQINGKLGAQSVHQMLADRSFVAQLEQAVETQQQKILKTQQHYQQQLQIWQKAYHKRSNIEELINRMRDSEAQEADKRLQKELDELSSLSHQRRA